MASAKLWLGRYLHLGIATYLSTKKVMSISQAGFSILPNANHSPIDPTFQQLY